VIAPVIPPQPPLQELVHVPAVTNRVVRPADDDLVYGLCSVGTEAGSPDAITFTALDWRPGILLEPTRRLRSPDLPGRGSGRCCAEAPRLPTEHPS
jgi:hypothetical protein